jgi:hypothetical protein
MTRCRTAALRVYGMSNLGKEKGNGKKCETVEGRRKTGYGT